MAAHSWPWAAGSATGIGSLPGIDAVEAAKLVFGELAALPHLPELFSRGPGADMVGRGAGFLAGIPVELYSGTWRVALRPGRDLRRTLDVLERDLDAMTEVADGYRGPLKVQAVGPWTLAASIDLPTGGRMLRDPGATRDLATCLADGLRAHVADIARRVPGASVLLQLDEPSLPTVLAGQVPTESGLGRLRPVAPADAVASLRSVVEAAGVPVVIHCCASGLPLDVVRGAGALGVSLDLSLVDEADVASMDALGAYLDAGSALFAGVLPSTGDRPPQVSAASVAAADRVTTLWRHLGFAVDRVAAQVVVTPTCGLGRATPEYARAAISVCVEAGRRLADLG